MSPLTRNTAAGLLLLESKIVAIEKALFTSPPAPDEAKVNSVVTAAERAMRGGAFACRRHNTQYGHYETRFLNHLECESDIQVFARLQKPQNILITARIWIRQTFGGPLLIGDQPPRLEGPKNNAH